MVEGLVLEKTWAGLQKVFKTSASEKNFFSVIQFVRRSRLMVQKRKIDGPAFTRTQQKDSPSPPGPWTTGQPRVLPLSLH
jgi:hypothetical protein